MSGYLPVGLLNIHLGLFFCAKEEIYFNGYIRDKYIQVGPHIHGFLICDLTYLRMGGGAYLLFFLLEHNPNLGLVWHS